MSTILVNTLTGTSTAGSISVTGEGNSTTTNLQQGLAKAFISFDGTGTVSTDDSFNISTLTDNALADYSIAYSNNIGTSNHPVTGSNVGSSELKYYSYVCSDGVAQTTSGDTIHLVHNDGTSNSDQDPIHIVIHGDLA
tara:strand:+ start:352 stop:765 length:414 start_codon:yes stop_codon:yes gene_type:complete